MVFNAKFWINFVKWLKHLGDFHQNLYLGDFATVKMLGKH